MENVPFLNSDPFATAVRAMSNDSSLEAMLETVMTSFNQPASKATEWQSALAKAWVTTVDQLFELLQADRTEKEAGRVVGSTGWRNAIAALGAASVPETAWAVIEVKLISLLDKNRIPPQLFTPPNKPKISRPLSLVDAVPLPWPIHTEGSLGPTKDKSGWRAFANAEHVNVFRFKLMGEGQREARCNEVNKRWSILKGPQKMLPDPRGASGTGGLG